jgi:solute carrier family 25 (mitochondrial aspartate/glutamate transporter), member 12/13
MEIVKLRMQLAGEGAPAGQPRLTAAQTVSELGFRGLYKGIASCWLRDIPFSIVFFPLYAHLNRTFNPRDDSIAGLFAAGAMAGSLAAGSVTPFDVVKTRLQVRGSPYTGIVDCMKKTAANDGMIAFAKGWLPRMLVQAPLFGCTLLSYEILKEFYRRQG